jgi:thioredoxin 1
MSVFDITSVDNLNKIIEVCAENGKYLVIKASAKWCKPCQVVQPKYEALAKEMVEQAVLTSFDVDAHQDIAEQFDISAMPTFVIVKGHDIINKVTGADIASVRKTLLMS